MLAKREDLLSWVLYFICSQTKFEVPIVNVCSSPKLQPYIFSATLEHS